ncbi:YndM family protein [Pullulanibacillus sp. KACC 23026]|uniref:YndM family protein n=1 Tax=Pullulanibacillus sp. KACC 23026 TaxID=3028315 RepID=UPI0023B14FE4|nr:YndM family protein [Pullulanibacillus sp. KACC 23026]WEG10818.1 YndM family protein [Pullulanibacillus sp. KACC 23026]
MKSLMIMLLKLVVCLIAFTVGLDLFFRATITEIVSFSILVTIVSYLIGDRILLPIFGNATATIIDFFIAYGVVWLFGGLVLNSYLQIAWGSVISAVIITVGEVFLHYYLLSNAERLRLEQSTRWNGDHVRGTEQKMTYMMEFAEENEENNPYKDKNNE